MATRDIKPGEVIFRERPVTFGPSENSKPVCLGCYRRIRGKKQSVECRGCGYPMCSEECSSEPEHRDNECEAFRENGYRMGSGCISDYSATTEDNPAYSIISPIRALKLRERDPERWKLLWSHMSHDKKRRASAFWRDKTKKIVEAMKVAIGLKEVDVKTVEIILGVLLVNDFEVGLYDDGDAISGLVSSSETSIRGLFALASIPSHNCVANATHDFSDREDGFVMTMRAVVKIPKGADITHSYTEVSARVGVFLKALHFIDFQPLDPVLYRKSLLQVGKFFHCLCPRCSDPTELGTYSSSVVCSGCKEGHLVSSDPATIEAPWRCRKCGRETPCEKVQKIYQGKKVPKLPEKSCKFCARFRNKI